VLFEDVYAELPRHLQQQVDALRGESAEDDDDEEASTVPFTGEPRRAVG
jgi:hypothetical protein